MISLKRVASFTLVMRRVVVLLIVEERHLARMCEHDEVVFRASGEVTFDQS